MHSHIQQIFLRCLSMITLLATTCVCGAQAPAKAAVPWLTTNNATTVNASTTKPKAVAVNKEGTVHAGKISFSKLLPELINTDTVPMVLAKFTPPATEAQVANSDYLLLDAPPISLAGPVTVHLRSELPGTEVLLLFNTKPRVNEPSLLSANVISPLSKEEIHVSVRLTATTELLLISRANGRWHKVSSEVKIAQKDRK